MASNPEYRVAQPKRRTRKRERNFTIPKGGQDFGNAWRRNPPERQFCEFAEDEGYSFTKRGWPDFICEDEDGFFFVEVKPDGKWLDPRQRRTVKVLTEAGFDCYVWTPSKGLILFEI